MTTLTPSLSALSTDADGDPINYLYEVSSTSDFGTIVAQSSGVSGSWPVSPALSDNTTYWWRARATDGTAISSNMSAASFFVNMANDAPTAPGVSAPTNGGTISTLTPVLSVTNASDPDNDALTYDFHVSLASNYTTTVSLVTGLSTTSWITGTLLDNMHYYWRSRAVDSHGLAGPWSTASFFVNTGNEAPSVPALSSPATGVEVASQTPVLTINPSNDPEGDSITYFYELDTVSSFDSGNKRTCSTLSNELDTHAPCRQHHLVLAREGLGRHGRQQLDDRELLREHGERRAHSPDRELPRRRVHGDRPDAAAFRERGSGPGS